VGSTDSTVVSKRGPALTFFAIVFLALAISDFMKRFGLEGADTGLVVLGHRLSRDASAVAGPAMAVVLVVYAVGIWRLEPWAVPLGWVYAAYVTANVVLFPFRTPQPADAGIGYWIFGVTYTILAIAGTMTCARLLGRRVADAGGPAAAPGP
jgi:hypothetical protein